MRFEKLADVVAVFDLGGKTDALGFNASLRWYLVDAFDGVQGTHAGHDRGLLDHAVLNLLFQLTVSEFFDSVLLELAELPKQWHHDQDDHPNEDHPHREPRITAVARAF